MNLILTDPYVLNDNSIQEPPTSLRGKLRYLGPGFILSASIVGSGELIATTALGARAGFVTFWVIIISCLVKVAIQVEFGKHAIHSGETVMTVFDRLPGKRFGRAHWTVWSWLFLMSIKILQVGGIVGGVALVLKIAFPHGNMVVMSFLVAAAAALLTFKGYYRFIEKASIMMMVFFSIFTIGCLISLQFTPYILAWSDVGSGLQFELPSAAVAVALGAFGITGVGGDEIIYYNYWCIEKGYAAKTGVRDDSPEWEARAKGWISVMYLDAIVAMIVYTLVTAAFYLLGAAVLHKMGVVPEGNQTIEVLSSIYTESLGPWARVVFLVGSFIVLFSTLFAALAAWIRVFADAFGKVGWINFKDQGQRNQTMAILAWFFPFAWAIAYLIVKMPVFMVLSGGIVGSIILFIVVYVALVMRYKKLPKSLIPGKIYDFIFWLSAISIAMVGVYSLMKLL